MTMSEAEAVLEVNDLCNKFQITYSVKVNEYTFTFGQTEVYKSGPVAARDYLKLRLKSERLI